jgi:parallel beta-helix repeat protein
MKVERTKTKLVISLLALGCTLTFLAFCMAEDTDPGLPPGPVIRAEAQPIPELPYIINEPGSYCLTQNLTHTDRYTNAIEITADNVTIDLGGYSLIGPTTAYNETCNGIYMDMRKNVEIRNGTITNFPYMGIFGDVSDELGEASGYRIISVRVMSTGAEGIVLWGLHHTVRNCTVTNTQLEIEQGFGGITCGPLSMVTGNVVSRHRITGIQALAGSTVHDNTIGECSYGIVPSDACSIIGNTIFFTFEGISLIDRAGCLIKGNTIRESQGNGITIEGFDNAIEENLVTSCEVGIHFAYEQNVFANNRALYNGTNFGGRIPQGVYDGGGNIGAGTFVGGNVGANLQLKAKPRALKKRDKE